MNPQDREIEILYHADDLVAVVKPAGMLVHRDERGPYERVLLNALRDQIGQLVYPVHRLDRNTSGIVVFGLSPEAAREAHGVLAAEDSEKLYLVLARGAIMDEIDSRRPLSNHAGEPRPARTVFRCRERFDGATLVEARLWTGRHHQIRRHLNHLGHHVVGDTTHGKGHVNRRFRDEVGLGRMFLHAWRLKIREFRGEPINLEAALPSDLHAVLERLRGRSVDEATGQLG